MRLDYLELSPGLGGLRVTVGGLSLLHSLPPVGLRMLLETGHFLGLLPPHTPVPPWGTFLLSPRLQA